MGYGKVAPAPVMSSACAPAPKVTAAAPRNAVKLFRMLIECLFRLQWGVIVVLACDSQMTCGCSGLAASENQILSEKKPGEPGGEIFGGRSQAASDSCFQSRHYAMPRPQPRRCLKT